ncbi:MAG: ABC transporter substrate-binding protein, partial [Acidimicrobiales bacterium]
MVPPGGRVGLVALALALALVIVAGCGGHGSRGGGSAPPTGGTLPPPSSASLDLGAALTMALGPAPVNWNQLSAGAGGSPSMVTDQVLPSVFVVQPDYSLALDTDVVTSATETSTDPQTVVYQINPKATWSDGVPFTAADFAYNWMAQSGNPSFSDLGGHPFTPASTTGYRDISAVASTPDSPDTATVTFSTPFPDWQTLFSDMVPAHIATKVGFDGGFTDPVDDVVSAGPFLVASYTPGQSLTLVRNARWWGPPASLSSVTFDFVSQPSVAGTALAVGQVGAIAVPPAATLLTTVEASGAVRVDVGPSPAWEELAFNAAGPSGPPGGGPWLADANLRQALMFAIDRSQMIASTVGAYSPATTPLGNRYLVPQQPGYADNSAGRFAHANLPAARALLAQAGYGMVGGALARAGNDVALRLATPGSAVDTSLAQAVATGAGALGIAVTVDSGAAAAADMAVVDRTASPDLVQ